MPKVPRASVQKRVTHISLTISLILKTGDSRGRVNRLRRLELIEAQELLLLLLLYTDKLNFTRRPILSS